MNATKYVNFGDFEFPIMYTFAAYIDDVILKEDPCEVWRFYRHGNNVIGISLKLIS